MVTYVTHADMSNPTAQEEKNPKWIKTRVQHVYRHRDSGRYYVRGFRQVKEIWKALKTKSAEVARAQAADVLKEINKPRILSEAAPTKPGKTTLFSTGNLPLVRQQSCTGRE